MYTESLSGKDREHIELLLTVARRYYIDEAKQSEIAREIDYSRVTVSRLLTEAKRRGIVRIEIQHPLERLYVLEQQLRDMYHLKEVRITATTADDTEKAAGRLAAEMLLAHCTERSTIAVSNGRSVAAAVEQVPRHHWIASCVVPILGMAGTDLPFSDSPTLCRHFAQRLGGRHWILPVPLVFETKLAAQAMRQEPSVAQTLELAARADAALVGVGAVEAQGASPILSKWITPHIQQELHAKKAVAHLSGHYLDTTGKHVDTTLCQRTVCLEPSDLRSIPFVVAVAYGKEKVNALRAVMNGRYADGLVTDEVTALALTNNGDTAATQ